MDQTSRQFLKDLILAPSPSGYEEPVQKVVREFAGSFTDSISTSLHGNVIASVNADSQPSILLAGHCDQIGLQVKHIDSDGYLMVNTIGGWDMQMLIGQRLQVWTSNGPVLGVLARKAIHLLTPDERTKVAELKDMWIDIGAKDEKAARKLVQIGDPVTLQLVFHELQDDLITAPGIDDKTGLWIVMEALRRVAAGKSTVGVHAASTVQEEIGLRGVRTAAYSVNPTLGLAVDVTHATDCPTVDPKEHGDVKIGKGPVLFRGPNINPVVFSRLKQIAEDNKIPVQIVAIGRPAGNDGNAMQLNKAGCAVGIIGVPNRYMHSPVEIASWGDLDHSAELISLFCQEVKADDDFTP
ncbi:Putative aminopeptidase YsdC [Polystyrenella longa]|uniref:Aminopeptidase YsdC n=2 Tax=Polystyrenella longa TaxID=2528007 RepID=A0A518CMV2_9PLAN|nr:Putative aminopeptidase YsdC [Polystyrenella longa]